MVSDRIYPNHQSWVMFENKKRVRVNALGFPSLPTQVNLLHFARS